MTSSSEPGRRCCPEAGLRDRSYRGIVRVEARDNDRLGDSSARPRAFRRGRWRTPPPASETMREGQVRDACSPPQSRHRRLMPRCRDGCGSCPSIAATRLRLRFSVAAPERRYWRRARGNAVRHRDATAKTVDAEHCPGLRWNRAPASTPRRRTAHLRESPANFSTVPVLTITGTVALPAASRASGTSRRSGSTATTSVTVGG